MTDLRGDDIAARLEADFGKIWTEQMQDLPVCHPDLTVEVIIRPWQDGHVAVLITPWMMKLMEFPVQSLQGGERDPVARPFPCGSLSCLLETIDGFGLIPVFSLFSPMGMFTSQEMARDAALGALGALFTPLPSDVVQSAPPAAPPAPVPEPVAETSLVVPNRRDLLRGLFGR